ncbi:hypothetical protein J437_LFUL005348 [Ladona fulva]|uniref:THAP-type domain-containing protein n=1 Tax=Ladona fulva TaxID=123851 RepID=A0A8K0NZ96_LADFU|nr:hypothetical protein J437_LFUL005348 [Ladona fulva]
MPKGAGNWCSAINCSNSSKKTDEISFFRFPKEEVRIHSPSRSRKWVIATRRQDLLGKSSAYLYNNCRICSNHFEDVMFLNNMKNRLHSHAVPKLFDVPNPPPMVSSKRKRPLLREQLQIKRPQEEACPVIMDNVDGSISEELPEDANVITDDRAHKKLSTCNESTVCMGTQTPAFLSQDSPRISSLRKKVKQLCECTRRISIKYGEFKRQCELFLPPSTATFVQNQVYLNKRKRQGKRCSSQLRKLALQIYFLSPVAYSFLQKTFIFPSPRSLRRAF